MFRLGLNIRQCFDCGWTMHKATILAGVKCALGRAKQLKSGDAVYITSDSRNNLRAVKALLPNGVRIFEDVPSIPIHTVTHPGSTATSRGAL